jgi:hypothetical protein
MNHCFAAQLVTLGLTGSWVLRVPAEVALALGQRRRIPVMGKMDGKPFRAIAYADDGHGLWLPVSANLRARLQLGQGSMVQVEMEPATDPAPLGIPPDVAQGLEVTPASRAAFTRLQWSTRKEIAAWILAGETGAERSRRLMEARERLEKGHYSQPQPMPSRRVQMVRRT